MRGYRTSNQMKGGLKLIQREAYLLYGPINGNSSGRKSGNDYHPNNEKDYRNE